MKYLKMPGLNILGSKLIYGTCNDTFTMGRNCDDILDGVVESGINIIDTARKYMNSEKMIGQWMEKRKNRNDLIIISKCAHPSFFKRSRLNEKDILSDLKKSLKYLKTDYIDIYLMHRDDVNVPTSVIVNIFNSLINQGKIKAYGCSNWSLKRIKEVNDYALKNNLIPMKYSSSNYSLCENVNPVWNGCVSLHKNECLEEIEYYKKNGMILLAYSSLGMGFLSGKLKSYEKNLMKNKISSLAIKGFACDNNFKRLSRCEELAKAKNTTVSNIALAYLMNQDFNVIPIVSSQNPKRIKDNALSVNIGLTNEECLYLNLENELSN